MRKITCEELKLIFDKVYDKIVLFSPEGIEIQGDHYRIIPTASWNRFDEAEIHNCSLYDDIEQLRELTDDPDRPCTFVDLDRLSAVLRAISHIHNP